MHVYKLVAVGNLFELAQFFSGHLVEAPLNCLHVLFIQLIVEFTNPLVPARCLNIQPLLLIVIVTLLLSNFYTIIVVIVCLLFFPVTAI